MAADPVDGTDGRPARRRPWAVARHGALRAAGWAVLTTAAATALAWAMFPWFDLADLVMVYLLGVLLVAVRRGRAPSLLAAVLGVASFNFFFVPPYYTFAVADARHAVTFLVMLAVAVAIGGLTEQMRAHTEAARQRERQTAALYALSRDLASTRGADAIAAVAVRHLGELFQSRIGILLADAAGRLGARPSLPDPGLLEGDLACAQKAYDDRRPTGSGTAVDRRRAALFLPLTASRGPVGVLCVAGDPGPPAAEQRRELEMFVNQVALAIEREQLAEEAEDTRVRMETERLRSTLLSSVSHDLRTPLATITGAVGTVLEQGDRLDSGTRRELLESVRDEAERLGRLVQNLLQMTRIESGALQLKKDWHAIEEVIGAALARLEKRLAGRRVHTRVPPNLPLAPMDDVLIEQVVVNLLDNAVKHTPPGSPISILAAASDDAISVEISDRGPGLRDGEEDRIFEKFHRGSSADGAGLGLAICEGIVRAHGGRIWAHTLPEGGAAFIFRLPLGGAPPAVVRDE